jgi:hypothetical protein
MTDLMNSGSGNPGLPGPVDGLALWTAEGSAAQVGNLSSVRLDANERLLIPFTTTMTRVLLHYVEYPALRGYVHCGGNCLLCRIGRQQESRDLWPVYDVLDGAVAVLPISPNVRPMALRPQLVPILRQLKESPATVLLAIRRMETGKFLVSSQPLPEGADDGAAAIQAFVQGFDAGQLDLGSVFPRLADRDLASIPEVATLARLKGIAIA